MKAISPNQRLHENLQQCLKSCALKKDSTKYHCNEAFIEECDSQINVCSRSNLFYTLYTQQRSLYKKNDHVVV